MMLNQDIARHENQNDHNRVELSGSPGSPYTRKMLGLLRFRRIPYTVHWGNPDVPAPAGYPRSKILLFPTFYFPDGENGELVAVTDSTPIIRRLEKDHRGRSVIPTDPVLRFLNELIEDYADEWLTKAMFHFRWTHEADWKNAAPLLAYWGENKMPEDKAEKLAKQFTRRQIDRLYVVGSNEVTAETIEASYARLIEILDNIIAQKGFVLGARPSSADFAIFGQLSQLAIVEPTSAAITNSTSRRVRAWVDLMEDLSGVQADEDGWLTAEEASLALRPLLEEIGRTYAPAMLANGQAVARGDATFETEIDGRNWTQPTFKYQAKCLRWLQEDYRSLSDNELGAVNSLLSGSGCEPLFH